MVGLLAALVGNVCYERLRWRRKEMNFRRMVEA